MGLAVAASIGLLVTVGYYEERRAREIERENIVQSFVKDSGYSWAKAEAATDQLMRPPLSPAELERETIDALVREGGMPRTEAERAVHEANRPLTTDERRRVRLHQQELDRSAYKLHCADDPHSIYC